VAKVISQDYYIDKPGLTRYYAQLEKNPLRSTKNPIIKNFFVYFARARRSCVASRVQRELILVNPVREQVLER
jgi:hypothetical protein